MHIIQQLLLDDTLLILNSNSCSCVHVLFHWHSFYNFTIITLEYLIVDHNSAESAGWKKILF